MKSKIYFRGSQKHGAALIEALESMGGRNFWRLTGIEEQYLYAIDEENRIISIKPNEVLYDDLLKSGMEIRVDEIPDKADADVGKELAETLAQCTWADLFLSMILLFSDCLKPRAMRRKRPGIRSPRNGSMPWARSLISDWFGSRLSKDSDARDVFLNNIARRLEKHCLSHTLVPVIENIDPTAVPCNS